MVLLFIIRIRGGNNKMDINKALRSLVTTGKVYFGIKEAKKALKAGQAKLIIFSSNCPQEYITDISEFKKVSKYNFNGTNIDLGSTCGKPFPISVLTVIKPGKSTVLMPGIHGCSVMSGYLSELSR